MSNERITRILYFIVITSAIVITIIRFITIGSGMYPDNGAIAFAYIIILILPGILILLPGLLIVWVIKSILEYKAKKE